MANGASRIFNFMKNAGTNTISEVVYVNVKSINPLIFNLENRLNITSEFYVLSDEIITSKLKIGDRLTAFTFNDGQCYFIQQCLNSNVKAEVIDDLSSSSSVDSLSANQGAILKQMILDLKIEVEQLEERITELENKE